MRKTKKARLTYHGSIGNHPQPSQARRYLSSCYSAARGRIQVANSFRTTTEALSTNDNVGVSEVTPSWIEDHTVPDSDLPQVRPEDFDPKYKAYQEDQVESDDEEENSEGGLESAKRKRTAGVCQAPIYLFSPLSVWYRTTLSSSGLLNVSGISRN